MPIKHADFGLNVLKYAHNFGGENLYYTTHYNTSENWDSAGNDTQKASESNLAFEELHSENVFVLLKKKLATNAAKSLQQKETTLISDTRTMAIYDSLHGCHFKHILL